MDKEYEVFELNQKADLLSIQCQCPQCRKEYMYGVPYVNVPCNSCGITYTTEFKQDIYTKKARHMNEKLAYSNGLIVRAEENYESSIIWARQHFIQMACWDVTEITRAHEEFRYCRNCGTCFDCFMCSDCKKHFKKNTNRRKQQCPDCKSTNITKTKYDKPLTDKDRKLQCPKCESTNIKMSRTRNKTKCHICSVDKLSEPKIKTTFEFTIKRRKAYRRENI